MENKSPKTLVKYLVVSGYILLVVVMLIGLISIYTNLVDFSEKKITNDDRKELLIVSHILSLLYEAEGNSDLLTFDSSQKYIESFNGIRPNVISKIDSLKQMTKDTIRLNQLDSLEILLEMKEQNLVAVMGLMDSLRKAPPIIRESINTYVPKSLNSNISDYLNDNVLEAEDQLSAGTDTTIVKSERKGLLQRLGDAFAGRQDSTIILQNKPSVIVRKDYSLIVDTIVNMVRYSERLNLENQKRFQLELVNRQMSMNVTNQLLTIRVDDLLKQIEKEEFEKSLALVEAKEQVLSRSYSTVFWVSIVALVIALTFGLMFILDFNKIQKYKNQLETSNSKIKKLLKHREKLMLTISHDIKVPMASILGYIELVESNVNTASHDKYLSNMKQSSEHVLYLVSNLLDYQRLESDTWSRNNINFSVNDMIENTVKSFKPLSSQKKLLYNFENNLPHNLFAFGDPFMIREIYSNIISNAIKYTFEGEVNVSASFDESKRFLSFSVKDTGIGISKDNWDVVFEEFGQIKSENIEHYAKGSGLGMAITKGLVEQLGGTIDFSSRLGVGSEFSIVLPIIISEFHEEDNDVIDLGVKNEELEGLSILVIDDDPILLTMVSEMLKTQGVNVFNEINPKHALDIIRKHDFDLIFMDIQMSQINGFSLLKQIIDSRVLKNKTTPIIALTATLDIELDEYISSGFSGFLSKPFTSTEIFNTISSNLKLNQISGSENHNNSPLGIQALIDYVKEDKDSSLAILQAFVDEVKQLSVFFKNSESKNKFIDAQNIAHKMLPLFKMMGDKDIVNFMVELERNREFNSKDLIHIIDRIDFYVLQAEELILEIKND